MASARYIGLERWSSKTKACLLCFQFGLKRASGKVVEYDIFWCFKSGILFCGGHLPCDSDCRCFCQEQWQAFFFSQETLTGSRELFLLNFDHVIRRNAKTVFNLRALLQAKILQTKTSLQSSFFIVCTMCLLAMTLNDTSVRWDRITDVHQNRLSPKVNIYFSLVGSISSEKNCARVQTLSTRRKNGRRK